MSLRPLNEPPSRPHKDKRLPTPYNNSPYNWIFSHQPRHMGHLIRAVIHPKHKKILEFPISVARCLDFGFNHVWCQFPVDIVFPSGNGERRGREQKAIDKRETEYQDEAGEAARRSSEEEEGGGRYHQGLNLLVSGQSQQ